MTAPDILVVDDDRKTVELIRVYLERANFSVRTAFNGQRALEFIHEREPRLVILDLMLPGLDGLTVCQRLRVENVTVPVVMLTARTTEKDKLCGLGCGADDYVTKPFSPRELVARVEAVLRRAGVRPAAQIQVGDLVVDHVRHQARLGGRRLHLTPREFDLLETLVREPGRAWSRQRLVEAAFGFDYDGLERTVDAHIARLRKKIEPDPACPTYIETIPGLGYRIISDQGP
jgi:DNA-binding response OmpR family regulator